jgi:hypothetical protein
MATATKRAVTMAMRVADKDEGDCKGGKSKSDGDGNEEGNYEEEGDGK